MIDHLLQFDKHLFYFINHDLGNAFFDWLMPILRNAKSWIPLYLLIIVFCVWKYKKEGLVIIVLMAACAGTADFTSVHFGKNVVRRLRPCNDPEVSKTSILRINGCGTGFSFPSTHASDHFAMAVFLCFVFRKKWRWIWLWALLWAASISFAQIYVGVHYPIDVFAGALWGTLVGRLIYQLFKKLQPDF